MPEQYQTDPVPVGSDPYQELASFIQIFDTSNITALSDDEFLAAPFNELCPSGDCVEDCRDLARLFQAVPDGVDAGASTYGRPGSDQRVTLFSVCTNMARAASIVPLSSAAESVKGYFPAESLAADNVTMVTSGIASCFASTCGLTREPAKCQDACSLDNLLASSSQLNFNLQSNNTGALACVSRLCDNTCGLPYADQDVLGIGVLTSYYIQALVLILCAAVFLASAAWQSWKWPGEKPSVHRKLKTPLETLLAVQTYFGFSAAVATFAMGPAAIDPLNGYALICVTIMGYLPPVFTLLFLHSHAVQSWYSTALVFASYMINTVAFFILHHNLASIKHDAEALTAALQSLFHSTSCGGSSAMSLCRQLTGMEPLGYFDLFLNRGPIPNVQTIPILWAWTTLVFVVLVALQIYGSFGSSRVDGGEKISKSMREQARAGATSRVLAICRLPMSRVLLLLTASLVFCLCLGYQYLVVKQYQEMDVIDRDGWSFGQVVAVLFWIPPFLDILHSVLSTDYLPVSRGESTSPLSNHRSTFKPNALSPWEEARPLAHSPEPSPGLLEDAMAQQGLAYGTSGHGDMVQGDYRSPQRRWTRNVHER